MFKMSLKYIYIHFVFMRYMFRPHRAIFRQHTIKESTHCTVRTLSVVVLKYVIVISIKMCCLNMALCG
jgi:hypothetical protein